jgi:hypothetical protein
MRNSRVKGRKVKCFNAIAGGEGHNLLYLKTYEHIILSNFFSKNKTIFRHKTVGYALNNDTFVECYSHRRGVVVVFVWQLDLQLSVQ